MGIFLDQPVQGAVVCVHMKKDISATHDTELSALAAEFTAGGAGPAKERAQTHGKVETEFASQRRITELKEAAQEQALLLGKKAELEGALKKIDKELSGFDKKLSELLEGPAVSVEQYKELDEKILAFVLKTNQNASREDVEQPDPSQKTLEAVLNGSYQRQINKNAINNVLFGKGKGGIGDDGKVYDRIMEGVDDYGAFAKHGIGGSGFNPQPEWSHDTFKRFQKLIDERTEKTEEVIRAFCQDAEGMDPGTLREMVKTNKEAKRRLDRVKEELVGLLHYGRKEW